MDFIGDPFRPLQPYILAAAFALARMLAMMIVFPVFDRLGVTGPYATPLPSCSRSPSSR